MKLQTFRMRAVACVAGVALLAFSGWASADPPSRVARLGYMSGAVDFSPAGETDWGPAAINRPLGAGDRLWTDQGARAEIQVGGASVRMNGATSVAVLNLDDRITQLQLTQGTLNVRVRRLGPNQAVEVDTPNLAFTLRKPGEYRIAVDPDGNATDIIVRKGQGEAYGEGAAYVIDSSQPYRFTGTGLREYEHLPVPQPDEFDRWASSRDRRYDSSPSARYVSPDVVGYQDLDANGTWRVEPNYGNVWVPNRVAAGWAPYRDGHWAWVDPWGWTWVDDAPWGFAVSHYGRWAQMRGTWGWVPGPVRAPAYYAPALVAFVGGNNFQLSISSGNVGGVAWFPLAPREVYRPSYPVSRGYFENVNRSNTVVNTTVINNTYNTYNTTNVRNVTNVVYANQVVPGAVVAVPRTVFVQSQPVSTAVVRVSREQLARATVVNVAAVAPTEKSVHGAGAWGDRGEKRGERPPERVFERPVVARTAPAAAPVGFAAQREQLTAKPGRPLEEAVRKALKPAAVAAAPAPVVKLVAPAQVAPPTVRPPPAAPGAKPGDVRAKTDERKASAAPAITGAAVAPPPTRPSVAASTAAVAPQVVPVPVSRLQEPRGRPDQRGNADQRGQAVAPSPPRPAVAAPAAAVTPQVAPVPAARPPEPRGRPDQRGNGEQRGNAEQRGQASAPPPPRPTVAAPPAAVASRQVAPVPAARPPEQRGRPEQRGNGEQRNQAVAPPSPPPQRAAEPRPVPPQVTASAPPAVPTRPVPPKPVAPPPVVVPAPPPARPVPPPPKPEPAPAARQAEQPRAPVAVPKPPAPPPPPQAKAAPKAERNHANKPKPAASSPVDLEHERRREQENHKQSR